MWEAVVPCLGVGWWGWRSVSKMGLFTGSLLSRLVSIPACHLPLPLMGHEESPQTPQPMATHTHRAAPPPSLHIHMLHPSAAPLASCSPPPLPLASLLPSVSPTPSPSHLLHLFFVLLRLISSSFQKHTWHFLFFLATWDFIPVTTTFLCPSYGGALGPFLSWGAAGGFDVVSQWE